MSAAQEEYRRLLALNSGGAAAAGGGESAHAAAMRVFPHKITPSSSPLTPFDDEFPLALDRIDECIAYLASHASLREAPAFLGRYRQLQATALGLVQSAARDAVERVVAAASAEVKKPSAPAAAHESSSQQQQQDALLQSQLHVRFRTELGHLRRLVALIEARAGSKRAYADLVRSIHAHYLDKRLGLVSEVARHRLNKVVEEKTAPTYSKPASAAPPALVAAAAGAASSAAAVPSDKGQLSGDSSTSAASADGNSNSAPAASPAGSSTAVTAAASPPSTPSAASSSSSSSSSSSVSHGMIDPHAYRHESPLIEAVRSSSSLMARMAQAEHALFHALFIAPPSSSSAGGGGAADGGVTSRGGFETARTARTFPAGGDASFFPSMPTHVRAAADAALGSMQEELCSVLSDALRPPLLHACSLDVLAEVVTVLREEVIGQLAAPRGPTLAPLARVVSGLVKDVQERLIFRVNAYILSDRLESFDFTAAYQTAAGGGGRAAVAAAGLSHASVSVPVSLADGSRGTITGVIVRNPCDYPAALLSYYLRLRTATLQAGGTGNSAPPPGVYESWFPVLDRVLVLLGKLHRVIEGPSFDALAQDAVAACSKVLLAAGAAVRANSAAFGGSGSAPDSYAATHVTLQRDDGAANSAPPAAPGTLVRGVLAGCVTLGGSASLTSGIDGDLLVIKSLLTLREQLSPFELTLASTTKSLDFSSTTVALSQLLTLRQPGGARGSMFSLSRDNAMLSLVAAGLPTVHESKVDAKADLEGLLKAACEAFIARIKAALIVGPLQALLSRHPLPAPQPPEVQAGRQNIAALLAAFNRDAAASLDGLLTSAPPLLAGLRRRMGLYLGSPVTATILFKPVREDVSSALSALRQHSYELFSLLVSEPGVEAPALASAAKERASVEGRIAALSQLLEASDQLAVDPLSAGYGYDDVLLPALAGHHHHQHSGGAGGGVAFSSGHGLANNSSGAPQQPAADRSNAPSPSPATLPPVLDLPAGSPTGSSGIGASSSGGQGMPTLVGSHGAPSPTTIAVTTDGSGEEQEREVRI